MVGLLKFLIQFLSFRTETLDVLIQIPADVLVHRAKHQEEFTTHIRAAKSRTFQSSYKKTRTLRSPQVLCDRLYLFVCLFVDLSCR